MYCNKFYGNFLLVLFTNFNFPTIFFKYWSMRQFLSNLHLYRSRPVCRFMLIKHRLVITSLLGVFIINHFLTFK